MPPAIMPPSLPTAPPHHPSIVQLGAESEGRGTYVQPTNIHISKTLSEISKNIFSGHISEIFQMDVLKPKDDPPETVSFSLVQYDTPKR